MPFRNYNKFKQFIVETDCIGVYHYVDTNVAFEKFHENLKLAYDTIFQRHERER